MTLNRRYLPGAVLTPGFATDLLASCGKEARCEIHDRTRKFVTEEIIDGHQHFVHTHTTDQREEDGSIKQHRFRVRCG